MISLYGTHIYGTNPQPLHKLNISLLDFLTKNPLRITQIVVLPLHVLSKYISNIWVDPLQIIEITSTYSDVSLLNDAGLN